MEAKEAIVSKVAHYGLPPAEFFHFVYVVENFDSLALSTAVYNTRDPFDHPSTVQAHLDKWHNARWVSKTDNDSYQITAIGHTIRNLRWRILEQNFFANKLNKNKALQACLITFWQIKKNLLNASQSPQNRLFFLRHEKGLKPPMVICPLLQFVEYRMDFGALRDDAHLCAWQTVAPNLSPLAWEVVSMLANGRLSTLDALIQNGARRGYTDADWETAVDTLKTNHWISQNDPNIQLTPQAIKKRQQVETITNQTFSQPWQDALPQNNIQAFTNNLEHLKQALSDARNGGTP